MAGVDLTAGLKKVTTGFAEKGTVDAVKQVADTAKREVKIVTEITAENFRAYSPLVTKKINQNSYSKENVGKLLSTIKTKKFDVNDPEIWKSRGIKFIEDNPTIAEKVINAKTADGRQLFTNEQIADFFCNIAESAKYGNKDYPKTIEAVLNNKKFMQIVENVPGEYGPIGEFWRMCYNYMPY